MTLKSIDNDSFKLSVKINANLETEKEYIDIIVRLDNKVNGKGQMLLFRADDFKKAMAQYRQWEQFIF